MNIHVYNDQTAINISIGHVQLLVEHVLLLESVSTQEVMIHFVSKEKISQLHENFFDDPSPTDCISFPIDEETLGEVFVCPEVAIEYAHAHNTDPKDEVCLYIVHGLLHLMGYDDIEEKDRKIMRKKEKSCMDSLCKHHLGIDSDHHFTEESN